MSIPQDKVEWDLPHLREALLFPKGQGRPMYDAHGQEKGEDFWSVKFYPFTEPDVTPVFAAVGEKRILVCRPPSTSKDGKETSKLEVIRFFIDEEEGVDNFACAWTKDAKTGDPLLCVAGNSGKIKILDVKKGEWIRALIGHGGAINDLAICPTNPYIIASGSDDCTVRLWSLDPDHAKQPCFALLEGYGHIDTVQTVSFHANGRYLLSAGIDRKINLWTLPEFSEANTGKSKPIRIYYPHFSTSELHSGIIDCIMWHGDLIFSKTDNELCIVLWSIDNFDSKLPPPEPLEAPAIPVPLRSTRSSFAPVNSTSMGYTSHLKFSIPTNGSIFFTRFSIFPGSHTQNPVLAFFNSQSKIYFWDLTRFREYHNTIDTFPGGTTTDCVPEPSSSQVSDFGTRAHPFLRPFQHRNRRGPGRPPRLRESESANGSNAGDFLDSSGKGKVDWAQGREMWKARYDMSDAHPPVEPHETVVMGGLNAGILGRQLAWSRDGKWCVGVGSLGSMVLLSRWEGRTGES